MAEEFLIDRAQEMAQREAGNGQATAVQRSAWRERLDNNDCRHVSFRKIDLDEGADVRREVNCGNLNHKRHHQGDKFHFIMVCQD